MQGNFKLITFLAMAVIILGGRSLSAETRQEQGSGCVYYYQAVSCINAQSACNAYAQQSCPGNPQTSGGTATCEYCGSGGCMGATNPEDHWILSCCNSCLGSGN